MNCLSNLPLHFRAIFGRASCHFSTKNLLYGCSGLSWRSSLKNSAIEAVILDHLVSKLRIQCYSSRKGSKGSSRSRKLDSESVMEPQDKDAFFVVRKGDIVGVYKNFTDCQAQAGSSICDPPVSVYKGYLLTKDAEEYLVSSGLKNALYTIKAADLKTDLFGSLVPCTFHDEASLKGEVSAKDVTKRSQEALQSENVGAIGSTSTSTEPLRKQAKLDHANAAQVSSSDCSCILEFDGASKGNPGQAGAGAVLRASDGNVICRLREGLGIATNNVAEYRAMLLGLKYALKKGFTKIQVQGDSKLVCMQVRGLWKVKNENMSYLYDEVKKLKDEFTSFEISHVLRGLNSDADAQANLAVRLADGQVQEE